MPPTSAGYSKASPDGLEPTDLLVKFGPTVFVDVGRRSSAPPDQPPDLPAKKLRALIDTGADGNLIDENLAVALNLISHDEGPVSGIAGASWAKLYTARVYVQSLKLLIYDRFAGAKLEDGGQWHRLILGRPFLRNYRMTYDGPTGQVEIVDV